MGLFDMLNSPAGMGLLSAVAAGAAGARKGTPWNNVGRGAMGGLAGYSQAQDQLAQQEENAFAKQYKQLQMDQMQRQAADQQKMREAGQAAAAKAMPMENVYVPTGNQSPLMPNLGGGADAVGDYSMMGGASPVSFTNEVQQRHGQFDPNAYSSAMMAELAQRGFADEALKYAPKQQAPIKVGDSLIDPTTFKPLYQAPVREDYNKPFLSDGSPNPAYQEYAKDHARAGAASTVTYAQPTPVFNPVSGKVELVQFGNRAGATPTPTGYEAPPKAGKDGRLPAAALKMQQEELNAISTAAGIKADLGALRSQIESGSLKFGPVENAKNKALNMAGMSTEGSRAFGTFTSSLEKLRNDSLRLNAGVQTDGDAQRAWNELFQNINDTEFVKQRLVEIEAINERAVTLRQLNIENIRQNFGADTLDVSGYTNQESVIGGKPAESRQRSEPAPGGAPAKSRVQAQPMPAKPSPLTLKKGVTYQTPKGPLTWNGKSFEDVQ